MLGQAAQTDWEAMWAPYDEPTYAEALSHVPTGAIVLDIGAGDLRFVRLAALRAGFVYAIERNPDLLSPSLTTDLPPNIELICADARMVPFPEDVDTAVLLMRHCTEFGLFMRKLEAVGCRTLITNARWGMGVERIDLSRNAIPFELSHPGWYACRCGATGYHEGPPEEVALGHFDTVTEVTACPACGGAEKS